jgi:hypothetical protein
MGYSLEDVAVVSFLYLGHALSLDFWETTWWIFILHLVLVVSKIRLHVRVILDSRLESCYQRWHQRSLSCMNFDIFIYRWSSGWLKWVIENQFERILVLTRVFLWFLGFKLGCRFRQRLSVLHSLGTVLRCFNRIHVLHDNCSFPNITVFGWLLSYTDSLAYLFASDDR